MDHRWGMRVAVNVDVHLVCQPRTIGVGRLVNISVSGALVRSGFIPELLARVRVIGPLGQPAEVQWDAMDGYVVRHNGDGFAMEWAELAPAGICTLLVASSPRRGRGVAPPQLICTRRDLPATFDPGRRGSG